jgi:hypothetical protein
MFPTSILQGTYNQSDGNNNNNAEGGDNLSYVSFTNVGVSASYMLEFNNNLYYLPSGMGRIKESTDNGNSWGNAAAVNNVAVQNGIPIVESNRILFVDGTSSGNHIESWDGTSTYTTTPVSNTSSLAQIGMFIKIGNYYYINDYAGPLERSTSLNSGWTNISNTGNHKFITESGGTYIIGGRAGANLMSKDNFNTVTIPYSSSIWLDAIATDGNGNWVGAGQYATRYSTDNGVTWGSISLKAAGDTGQINIGSPTNILNLGNKFVYLDRGSKKLLSISTTLSATPTVTVEHDFTNGGTITSNPLTINKIGNALYVTDYYNIQYGYHKINIT